MEISMTNTLTTAAMDAAASSEMMITRLPSWGDPILPECGNFSEEEFNQKFPFPGIIPGEQVVDDDDDDDDCIFRKLSEQELDQDITSLWQREEEREEPSQQEIGLLVGMSYEEDDDDNGSSIFSHQDEHLCSEDYRDDCEVDDPESLVCSANEDESPDAMEMEESEATEVDRWIESSEPIVEWTIQAYSDTTHRSHGFKLKASGGAYMQLLENEVMESIGALLEDTMGLVLFEIQSTDGQSIVVDSSQVLTKVTDLMEHESRKRLLDIRDDCEYGPALQENDTRPRKILRIPSIVRRNKPKEYAAERTKRSNRLSSAWRALSGRSKIRPKPPARVE